MLFALTSNTQRLARAAASGSASAWCDLQLNSAAPHALREHKFLLPVIFANLDPARRPDVTLLDTSFPTAAAVSPIELALTAMDGVHATFVTSLLRLVLWKFVTLIALCESSSRRVDAGNACVWLGIDQ
ncbi:hypothetical protein C8R43DRAFT_960954 [Mycena crocata]|nr:hypothetical protein C8R43DRAFT_960954 [Mycena crocata]